MAILVNITRVTGMEPAIFDRLGGFFGVLIVTLKDTWAFNEYLSILSDLDLYSGRRLTHASKFEVIVPVKGVNDPLSRAVEVFQLDAGSAKEADCVWAKGRAAGVGKAYTREAQLFPQRLEDGYFP